MSSHYVSSNPRQAESALKSNWTCTSASEDNSKGFIRHMEPKPVSSVVFSSSQPIDDSLLSATRLDTSTLRRRLSALEFDSTSEVPTNVRRHAKSASEIILSRNSSADSAKVASYSPPRPKVQKLRRRKQEFDQLLQTPPFKNVAGRTRFECRKSEADSGFVSGESGTSGIESDLKLFGSCKSDATAGLKILAEDSLVRSETPPCQIRLRSPLVETKEIVEPICAVGCVDGLEEEDINLMLFTPFKIVGGGTELPELSPDIELSASIVAGSESWVSFTPVSASARARTSTPCRQLNDSPENDSKRVGSASSRLSALLTESDANGSYTYDAVSGHENMSVGGLPSWDCCCLDEAIELDETDLTFR